MIFKKFGKFSFYINLNLLETRALYKVCKDHILYIATVRTYSNGAKYTIQAITDCFPIFLQQFIISFCGKSFPVSEYAVAQVPVLYSVRMDPSLSSEKRYRYRYNFNDFRRKRNMMFKTVITNTCN